jgi:hypothetical protein
MREKNGSGKVKAKQVSDGEILTYPRMEKLEKCHFF